MSASWNLTIENGSTTPKYEYQWCTIKRKPWLGIIWNPLFFNLHTYTWHGNMVGPVDIEPRDCLCMGEACEARTAVGSKVKIRHHLHHHVTLLTSNNENQVIIKSVLGRFLKKMDFSLKLRWWWFSKLPGCLMAEDSLIAPKWIKPGLQDLL